jgi:hypothetical protein
MFCLFDDCEGCGFLLVGANNFYLGDPDNLAFPFIKPTIRRNNGRMQALTRAADRGVKVRIYLDGGKTTI